MQLGQSDTRCVRFNGNVYRVDIVRTESPLGIPEVVLWLGDVYRKLADPVDEAAITRVATEILGQCQREGTLHRIPADPYCEDQSAKNGSPQ